MPRQRKSVVIPSTPLVLTSVPLRDIGESLLNHVSHKDLHDFIVELDEGCADYDFTLKLARSLVKGLVESADPSEPFRFEDLKVILK